MRASSSLTSSLQPWYMSSSANWNREEGRGRMFIIRGTLFMLRLLWHFQVGEQAKTHKRFMKFISAGHNVSAVVISDTFLKPCLPHGEFSHPGVSHLSVSCFSFASRVTVGKKREHFWMFKATRQLWWQLKQSSLDRRQQVERRRVTVCSRPSCQAYYCNDFYCFKMSRHTPETQCMKVISFHCEQTEASLRGNRTSVWPLQ